MNQHFKTQNQGKEIGNAFPSTIQTEAAKDTGYIQGENRKHREAGLRINYVKRPSNE